MLCVVTKITVFSCVSVLLPNPKKRWDTGVGVPHFKNMMVNHLTGMSPCSSPVIDETQQSIFTLFYRKVSTNSCKHQARHEACKECDNVHNGTNRATDEVRPWMVWFYFWVYIGWSEKKRDNQFSYSNGSDAYDRCSHRGVEVTQDSFIPLVWMHFS